MEAQRKGMIVSNVNRGIQRTSVALGISLAAVVIWIAAIVSNQESTENLDVVLENRKSAETAIAEGNASERVAKRSVTLWNPSQEEIEGLAKHADSLAVLYVMATPHVYGEKPRLPGAFFQSLSQFPRLMTVVIGSHRRLKATELNLLSNVRTLRAAIFYFDDDTLADDQTLNSLGPFQQLELIGVYGGSFSEKSLNEFKKRNANTQIELYRPGVYGDVFDWNGCINGKFIQKYFSPRRE